uniref:G-protein coupled receptors family 1 profile domain-containing protein n=1 Tax=Canis lupus familiaris TaxID=9615 RepID=A0A8P0PLI3_CANLF
LTIINIYAPKVGAALLAVFGNPRVVISILHVKQLHSPTSVIPSLACADSLVRVTVMSFIKVRSVDSCQYFGPSFCTFHMCCKVAFCYSSLFHLYFISIDRYLPVTVPLDYPTKFTVTVSGICVSISWILLLIYSGAMFYTGIYDDGLEELVSALSCVGGCQTVVNQDWVLIDFLFFIPLLMIILYSNIFLVARQQANNLGRGNLKQQSHSSSAIQRSMRIESKKTKSLFILCGSFVLLWMVFFIVVHIPSNLNFTSPYLLYLLKIWIGY